MQIGPYVVEEELARGGMGVVYRARDARGQTVALKLLLAQRSASGAARRRLQAEATALARLRHPYVVSILDAGEDRGAAWLALDYVEGVPRAAAEEERAAPDPAGAAGGAAGGPGAVLRARVRAAAP